MELEVFPFPHVEKLPFNLYKSNHPEMASNIILYRKSLQVLHIFTYSNSFVKDDRNIATPLIHHSVRHPPYISCDQDESTQKKGGKEMQLFPMFWGKYLRESQKNIMMQQLKH